MIEVSLDLGGWPVTLADTAGLRDSTDVIEREGVRRTLKRAEQADLRLGVLDAGDAQSLDALRGVLRKGDIFVLNKVDLTDGMLPPWSPTGTIGVSARSGWGIEYFLEQLTAQLARMLHSAAPLVTRERHRIAVSECQEALHRAVNQPQTELLGEDLRLATRALGRITGRVDVDDILDAVFRDFCIGK